MPGGFLLRKGALSSARFAVLDSLCGLEYTVIMPITLRPINPATDAKALHTIFGDEAQCLYMPWPARETVAQTQAMLAERAAPRPLTDWTILARDGESIAGRVSLFSGEPNASAPDPSSEATQQKLGEAWEIGVMICPAFQGQGIAYEACCRAIDFIDEYAKPRRIAADIDPDNTGSIRLFKRLGFAYEGTLRNTWDTHIGVRDTYLLSLIDSDLRPWRTGAN